MKVAVLITSSDENLPYLRRCLESAFSMAGGDFDVHFHISHQGQLVGEFENIVDNVAGVNLFEDGEFPEEEELSDAFMTCSHMPFDGEFGMGVNMNRLIVDSLVNGADWLFQLDSDDIVHEMFLVEAEDYMKEHVGDMAIIVGTRICIDENGSFVGMSLMDVNQDNYRSVPKEMILAHFYLAHPRMVSAKVLKSMMPDLYDTYLDCAVDWEFYSRVVGRFHEQLKVVFLPGKMKYYQRLHPASIRGRISRSEVSETFVRAWERKSRHLWPTVTSLEVAKDSMRVFLEKEGE